MKKKNTKVTATSKPANVVDMLTWAKARYATRATDLAPLLSFGQVAAFGDATAFARKHGISERALKTTAERFVGATPALTAIDWVTEFGQEQARLDRAALLGTE